MSTSTPAPAQAGGHTSEANVLALLKAAGLTDTQVHDAIAQAEITGEAADAKPSDEMNARFRGRSKKKGLRGKALGVWLLTGDSGVRTAAAKRREAAKTTTSSSGTQAAGTPRAPREGSAMHAAVTILKDARQPLAVQEIYDRAVKRGLAGGLKGKTPVATLGAQLATANKKGVHVERPEPGKYQLRSEGK